MDLTYEKNSKEVRLWTKEEILIRILSTDAL